MRGSLLALLLMSSPANAGERKSFYVRAGVVHVSPLSSSREMELSDVDGAASLAVQNGPIAGSGATVSSATVPGIIVGYVLWSACRSR